MPDLERLHLRRAASLAAALYDRGNLVVDAHERERTAGLAAAGELFAIRTERREVRAGAAAKLEEHGLARGQAHDRFHVVIDALNKTGRALREFVRILRLLDVHRFGVPAPIALRADDAVDVEQADVEPHGRIERAMLMQAEPGQVTIESLGVVFAGKVAVGFSPVGDRARDAMNKLPHAALALRRAVFAIKILAHDDIGGQLRPERRNLSILWLEHQLAVFVLDLRAAQFPLHRVERIGDISRAEFGVDFQPLGKLAESVHLCTVALGGGRTGRDGTSHASAPSSNEKDRPLRAAGILY